MLRRGHRTEEEMKAHFVPVYQQHTRALNGRAACSEEVADGPSNGEEGKEIQTKVCYQPS